MPSPRFAGIALLTALSVTALVGCAATPAPVETDATPTTTPTTDAGAPAATPEATQTTAPTGDDEATCENILSAEAVAELQGQGWSFKAEPFFIGETEITGGVSCTWADYSATGGNLLIYGWAPMVADEAIAAQAQLEQLGWIREDSADGVYLTEDPAQAITVDENGYGMTYLFGNGWVSLSDTRAGLPLVTGPQA